MANNNLDVGITIRANGGRQASAEINQVRDSVSGAGNASQNAGRQFAAMATGMSNAERDAARLATSVARATAIYNDHVARLTLSSNAYRAQQLSLQGLNAAQIRHIQTLEASSAAATRAASAYNTLGTVIGSTVGLAIVLLAHDMLKTVEQVQNMEVRLKGLTKSAQDYAQVQAYLVDVSARHHKNQLVLADSFSRLLTLEQSGIVTRKQSIALLEGMSNAASKTGATTEQLKQSMFGFSQAMGAGIVHMEELNQVTEPLPGLLNKMAESAGYSVGEFRNLVAEGKITSDVFGKIMVSSFEQYQGAAEAAGETLTAQYADISNAWTELAAVIEQPVADVITPVLEGIAWVIKGLIQDFRELKQVKDAIFGKSVTGGAPDNGMQIDLTGRAKPPGEVDATKASQAAIRKEIEATAAANTKGAKAHKAAAKVHKEAMSDEEKAAKSLQSAYDSQVKSLLQSLAASKDSSATAAMEYDVTEGALKGLVETKKLYLLQLTAEIENNKLAAQETETKKSEMDALIDKYNQLTMSAREYYQTRLDGEGIKGADQASLLQQFDKNTKIEAQKKATEDSRAALQAYIDDVDNATTSMDGLAASATNVFDASLGGFNAVSGALQTMLKNLEDNKRAFDNLAKSKAIIEQNKPVDKNNANYVKDLEIYNKARTKYEKDYAELQNNNISIGLDGIRQMSSATASMFKEGSAEAQAFQLIGIAATTVQGVLAILTQGQGEPYSAWARIAAMTGLVSGLIASIGGVFSGGGSGSVTPPAPPNSADTGTVLGDKTAQSESINNVYDLLKSIHADEYAELRGINKGVAALSGGILGAVTKTFQTGAITGTSAPHLGESKYTLVSGGLATASVVLADILGGIADFAGQMYTTEQHLGGSKKKPTFSFQDYFTAMDAGVTESLKGMFAGIGDTMKSVSDQLGKDIGQDLNTKLNAAIIPALKIDILGLSGEDAVKKVNAVISTAMDTVATQVFGGIISEYQKLGEGMLETAVRIVSEIAVVKDALAQSGLSMSGNAIDLADSLVQAAGGLEQFQQQFEGFYDAFFTDIDKQNRLQTRLNETFAEVYMLLPRTREEYAKVLGALNLTSEADRERYSLMLQLSSAADSYYKMIEEKSKSAADLNAARVSQEIELMRLQGDAAGALALERRRELEAMDETLRAMQRLIYTYSDLSDTLTTAYNNAADLLTQTFTKFFNLAKSLVQYRDALKVGDLSTGSPESKYKTNKAEFERVKAIIAGGKGTTELSEQRFRNALESLQSVSDKFLTSSRDYNASGKGYAADYQSVITTLTQGSSKSLNIASTAERQLNALNDMVSGLTTLNLSVIKLDGSIGKVDGSVDDVGARVRVSNEQLRDVNGSIKTGNTWLGKVDTKTDKVSGQLTSANVWIREGNKWLRLVDGSTGRVNEKLKDSNLWIKEGNHYLSLVDKKTGLVNDKLINVDGSVKKVYQSTDKAPSATDLVRQAINGTGGLKDATKDVKKSVKELNSKDGLSGAIGGVKSAVGSVRDAVKGMTAAIIAINKLQADRDKAAAAAAKAEAKAAAQRAREQAALDKAARDKAAAALYQQKQQAYGAIVGKTDWNAMKWLAKNAGFDEATSSTYASSWAPWAKSLIGDFDPNKTLAQYSQLSTLMDSFRKFLEASALGRGFPVDAAFFSRRAGEINGSHANGLDFVPFDGYRAELHKGERVLTAAEVRNSDKASKETIKICNEILAELKAANKQRGAVAVETLKKVDKLVEKTDAQTRAVRRIST